MSINLAGLGVIYDLLSTQNQQFFQLKAVPGSLTLVAVDGVVQNPDNYSINNSVLVFSTPLAAGRWVYVISGQGGTFVPQSYVDDAVSPKANKTYVDSELQKKIDKTGGSFTGPVTVQEPSQPMHPATKQMFDTLPQIATPTYVDNAVQGKADESWIEELLEDFIPNSDKGAPNGVTRNDATGKIFLGQFPEVTFNDDKAFSKFGPLTLGNAQGRWYPRYPGIIKGILGYVESPSAGADIVVDINKNGTSMFPLSSQRLRIPSGANFAEYVFPTPPMFIRGDYISVELEQVGSTATGTSLTLQLEHTYTP